MLCYLAYAEGEDPSGSGLTLVVLTGGLVVVFGLLALIPWRSARIRWAGKSQTISALTALWTVLAVGITLNAIIAQMNWQQNYLRNFESGYLDPRDVSDKPPLPWLFWLALAVVYAGLVCWSRWRPRGKMKG